MDGAADPFAVFLEDLDLRPLLKTARRRLRKHFHVGVSNQAWRGESAAKGTNIWMASRYERKDSSPGQNASASASSRARG